MKPAKDWLTRKVLLSTALLAVILTILPSCSLFSTKETCTTVLPKKAAAPKSPETSLPYHTVNLECPLSSVSNPKIFVFKSDRRLMVVQDGVLIRDYLAGLGPNPRGDKLVAGDGRTPEGEFFVCVKNPWSKFYKSLGLSYPDPKHAEQGLIKGIISPDEYRQIISSFESKAAPPWNTKLGGAIMIHGGGGHCNWTQGCIAVGNSAMDELFQVVSVGTPVVVLP